MLPSRLKTTFCHLPDLVKQAVWLVGLVVVFLAGAVTGVASLRDRNDISLRQFWQAYDLIKSDYVGSIDIEKAAEGATKGLVESLGDPYSAYLTNSEQQSLKDELSGTFEGIGAELVEKDGYITVVAPLSDTPAEVAGLKAQDIILKVNDQSTEDMSVEQVVDLIRGPKDSQVKLTVARDDNPKLVELTITRELIKVNSVRYRMIGSAGYIEIRQFGDDTVDLAKSALSELSAKSPKAIVIDLRNNPGGYLDAVPPIAGLFIAPAVVTIERFKTGQEQEVRSTDVPVQPSMPVYLLINGGSASAAEILAGCLQDYGRATLIGEKTFGKGSVQDIISLKQGALRLTIAEWLTPKKREINKVGIEPDVKITDEKTDTSDPVLDKALELAKAN